MEWAAWEPTYRRILADFGYQESLDEAARDELDALLTDALRAELPDLQGQDVVIVGGGSYLRVPEGHIIVADPRTLPPRRPDIIVTDLDGDVTLQVALNALGVPLVVHAHGDNRPALAEHVPAMRGPLMGSTQSAPRGRVHNWGGFTDGDRACCLAVALGATRLTLVGFDFDAPAPKASRDPVIKSRKLAWARRIIDSLGVPVRMT